MAEDGKFDFGKWLRQERRTRDLTQEAFADQVGIARITLRKIESGELKPSKELALLLVEKIGIPEAERTAWVAFARGLAELPLKPANPLPPRPRTNLPAALTTFIGRQKELTDVIQLIGKNRLVTLTGSGGVGKTRLSIQAASSLLAEYPVGVWLVELAPLSDPALVAQSFCAALGVVPEGGGSELEALVNYLHAKKILLVVDNCEHLLDAAARLCQALLQSCPELHILATSREALGIPGEAAYRVPSLSLPNVKDFLQLIQNSEAVKLFVERAAAANPEFELNEANAAFVIQICQRLDGIALALELAAARLRMMTVEQIAARLDDAFRLLTGGSRTALPRQQTLRALIDWSYNLLVSEEQEFLQKLAVFTGGWTLEAAEAVCAGPDAFELLSRLVDKSLVAVSHVKGGETRYHLLETVRQYAFAKLVEGSGLDQLKDAHLDYFLQLGERSEPNFYTRKAPKLLDAIERDYANFHSALEWADERDSEAGLRLANALFTFWRSCGEYQHEGMKWFDQFLRKGEARRNRTRALALINVYKLIGRDQLKVLDNEKAHLEVSLALARELQDDQLLAITLEEAGRAEIYKHNLDAAQALYEQSLERARRTGDNHLIGKAIYRLGGLAFNRGDSVSARLLLEESRVLLTRAGDIQALGLTLNFLGLLSNDSGDWGIARRYFEEALTLAQETRDWSYISVYLCNLGRLARSLGEFDRALSLLQQARTLVQDTPEDDFLCKIICELGEVARLQGRYGDAADLLAESLALPSTAIDLADAYSCLADVERLRGRLAEAKNNLLSGMRLMTNKANWFVSGENLVLNIAFYALACQMPQPAACILGWYAALLKNRGQILPPVYQAEFEQHLGQARAQLSEAEFNAAWAEGQTMSAEQIQALAWEVLQAE